MRSIRNVQIVGPLLTPAPTTHLEHAMPPPMDIHPYQQWPEAPRGLYASGATSEFLLVFFIIEASSMYL